MTEFTKEQLRIFAEAFALSPDPVKAFLPTFALAQMERAENAEAERDDAVERWARRAKEAEARLESVEAERDRLKEELEEATARGPHYIRDSRLRADGMRAAAEIARNLRPQDTCTCGNYLSFRNGVPGHLPGCLVGECIEVADEIEGRAEEIDRSNRE